VQVKRRCVLDQPTPRNLELRHKLIGVSNDHVELIRLGGGDEVATHLGRIYLSIVSRLTRVLEVRRSPSKQHHRAT
jgi:hypothetical protein